MNILIKITTTIILIASTTALTGCATMGKDTTSRGAFYDEAEQFNRAAAMYCDEKGVRTYMSGKNNILFIVCKDGSRFTIAGGL